jgi:hypothetical protein
METIYYVFGSEVVRAYETDGFNGLKKAIDEGHDYFLVAYDDDMTPSELLVCYTGYGAFAEIEGEEFDELAGN